MQQRDCPPQMSPCRRCMLHDCLTSCTTAASQLERELGREIGCSAIHGDKDQRQRDMVLANFKVRTTTTSMRLMLCA